MEGTGGVLDVTWDSWRHARTGLHARLRPVRALCAAGDGCVQVVCESGRGWCVWRVGERVSAVRSDNACGACHSPRTVAAGLVETIELLDDAKTPVEHGFSMTMGSASSMPRAAFMPGCSPVRFTHSIGCS